MKNNAKIITLIFYYCFIINVSAQKKINAITLPNNNTFVFNSKPTNRILLPFGNKIVFDEILIDTLGLNASKFDISVSNFENKIKKLNFISFQEKPIAFFNEDFYLNQQLDKNLNLYDLKVSTKYIIINDIKLYFIHLQHIGNRIFVVTVKKNKILDIKWIYFHYNGEMGFTYYKFFEISKKNIISIRDYEFTEEPFKSKLLEQYKINTQGKFIRYYQNNGNFTNIEEQGLVKNNSRDGLWIETKPNNNINLSNFPEFADNLTYSEINYESGIPTGEGKFYKLIQDLDENGQPILSTRKKGALIYTETFENGETTEIKFIK